MKTIFKKTLFVVILLGLMAGCSRNEYEIKTLNEQSLDSPTKIGTIEGIELYRIVIYTKDQQYDHYVYFTRPMNTNVTTVNHLTKEGKHYKNNVEVFINGKKVE